MSQVMIKFVSKKVNKVRWQASSKDKFYFETATIFAAGSWDDFENNAISLWEYNSTAKPSDVERDNLEPELLAKHSHMGDVMDLQFANPTTIVTGSSTGSLHLYKWNKNSKNLTLDYNWKDTHSLPCTGIAIRDEDLCSIGEDGKIFHYNLKTFSKRLVDGSSTCSLTALANLRYQEIITGNLRGYLRLWDLRQATSLVTSIPTPSNGQSCVRTIAIHPTQGHVVVSGGEDGLLYVWDLRHPKGPSSILDGHQGSILEAVFHPTRPSHLFTCGSQGMVLHWDVSQPADPVAAAFPRHESIPFRGGPEVPSSNPWLLTHQAEGNLKINSLTSSPSLPINSLDVRETTLVCGSDSEALFVIPGLPVH